MSLPLEHAGNVFVAPLERWAADARDLVRLSHLPVGQDAEIVSIVAELPGADAAPAARSRLHAGHAPAAGAADVCRRPARLSRPRHHHRTAARPGLGGHRAADRGRIVTGLRNEASRHERTRLRGLSGGGRTRPDGDAGRRRRSRDRAGGQSEYRQEHALQRADRAPAAHRELAWQDGDARRRRLRLRQGALQDRRPARYLLAAVGLAGRGGRARLHPVRPATRRHRRHRCERARAQPESRAAGAGDHRPRRRRREPDGRGATQGPRRRHAQPRTRSRRAGDPDRRAHGRGPARAAHGGGRRVERRGADVAAARDRHARSSSMRCAN